VRAEVDSRFGSTIRDIAPCVGNGVTPGLAAVLTCVDGSSAFVKALPVDGPSGVDSRELAIASALPIAIPLPAFRFAVEQEGRLLLCFAVAPGRAAREPWQPAELAAALHSLTVCTSALTPDPLT